MNYRPVKKRVADLMELASINELPKINADLKQIRKLDNLVDQPAETSTADNSSGNKQDSSKNSNSKIYRMDAYFAMLESKTKKVVTKEVEDGLAPDLSLEGSYKTNAYEDTATNAANRLTDSNHPTMAVGLKLTWLLDSEVKNGMRNSSKQEALASELRSHRKNLESDAAWSEIQRRHSELSQKIISAQLMAQVQLEKSNVERDKLSKGRTVTSQVITAEQDADEAQSLLTKLRTEQRKLEANTRLFIRTQEDL
jgi:hypothetical protein